jgi:hypothetical protein
MPDEKPSALDDVRKGLGLLFRAAKTTVEKLPTKDLEEVVVTSAREVGRAIESVGKTIEREVFGKKGDRPGEAADGQTARDKTGAAAGPHDDSDEPPPPEAPKPPDAA